MPISVGDKLPSISVKYLGAEGMEDLNSADLVAGKKVIIFGVPAAFSPTCSEKHVPGFLAKAAEIKAKGVDLIICHSVNDPFVMKAWGKDQGVEDEMLMFPDAEAALTKALGTEIDLSAAGLGLKSKRYSMLLENGKICHMAIEATPGDHGVSSADAMLALL